MKEYTLRAKIVTSGTFLLFFTILIFGIISYYRYSDILEQTAKRQLSQIAVSISTMMELSLKKEMQMVQGLAADRKIIHEAMTGKRKVTIEKLTDFYLKMKDDYDGMAAFDKNGMIYAGADKRSRGISIADRDYFQKAREGKSEIGVVVPSKKTGATIFVICSPILSPAGKFIGGIMGVIKAEFWMKYIDSMKIGRTGYAVLIDKSGIIFANSVEKQTINKRLNDIKGLELPMESLSGRDVISVEYKLRNIRKLAGIAGVKISGWQVVVTQRKDEALLLAYTNAKYIVFFGVIFITLGVVLLLFFSKQISMPVQIRMMRLNQAVEQADEAFFILDSRRNLLFYNEPAATLMAHEPDIGGPVLLKDQGNASLSEILSIVESDKIWNGRIQWENGDGRKSIFELSVRSVHEESGSLNSYLAIGRDVTSMVHLQEQINQSQKMEAIGTLAGGISHDFNNILSAILGYSELLEFNMDNKQNLQKYIAEITKASLRARDLVGHIMAFSRKNDEKQHPMILDSTVKDSLKIVRASLPSTIKIADELESSAPIMGNQTQIHQLVMNLCTNAAHAMSGGGGVLTLRLYETDGAALKARHPEAAGKSYLCLEVSDTGTGIPSNIIDKIYDPFFTTKPVGSGTGMGLSVVHGIVKSLDGFIEVSSKEGAGTIFSVYFPAIESVVEIEEEAGGQNYLKGSGHILFVDDEASIIDVGKMRLEELGYTVEVFLKSSEAFGAFEKKPDHYDLVLTDYTMPDLTGLELAQKIKSINSTVPVLICSGYSEMQSEIEKMKGIYFLKKPIMMQELSLVLGKILNKNNEPVRS